MINKYFGYLKTSFKTGLIYRLNISITLLNNVLLIFLYYFLWKAVYINSATINDYSFMDVFVYFLLVNLLRPLIFNDVTWKISSSIRSGSLITELIKPVDIICSLLFKEFGMKLLIFIMNVPIIIALYFYFIKLNISISAFIFFKFLISVVLSFFICFYLNIFIGVISFYTINSWGVAVAYNVILGFCSGVIIPLDFLPDKFVYFLDFLPFKYLIFVPVKQILLNYDQSLNSYVNIIGIQIFWLFVLYFLSKLFWNYALRRFNGAGG